MNDLYVKLYPGSHGSLDLNCLLYKRFQKGPLQEVREQFDNFTCENKCKSQTTNVSLAIHFVIYGTYTEKNLLKIKCVPRGLVFISRVVSIYDLNYQTAMRE